MELRETLGWLELSDRTRLAVGYVLDGNALPVRARRLVGLFQPLIRLVDSLGIEEAAKCEVKICVGSPDVICASCFRGDHCGEDKPRRSDLNCAVEFWEI